MSVNPLPPQAYTKDTLVKAYQWLQHQNDGIREMATNPDILVSLFLKARLQGESALERPSIQNFKSELKSLAGMMGDFEVLETQKNLSKDFGSTSATNTSPSRSTLQTSPTQPGAQAHAQMAASVNLSTVGLDSRSKTMIQEVKVMLNLSTEDEALRALIAAGHSQLKKLF